MSAWLARCLADKNPYKRKKDPIYYQYLEITGFSGIIIDLQYAGTGPCRCRFCWQFSGYRVNDS
jgi:hypothetical protein